ncbi:glycosyltransferase family 2 protein [Paracoccus sp. CPCC 101403]|uniref:Glycosyltransferase family 2 protein n=1 Tax=Paracoccus broussonetiae TaxID=3075834 RepID=A0ABU3ECS6_9RHOB|nr:glycosyltransferase family 2 protein [Paracoccus sp. CPCC 101403]
MKPILILMATRNGGRFISDQLESIARQSHADWQLWVSDDSSTDATLEIVGTFAARRPQGQIKVLRGPGIGATENFRSLLRRADLAGRCLAFCDQDDVWDADHLARGLQALTDVPNPLAVYGCRMRVCDAALQELHLSPRPARPLGFRNALVQNMLSGNTMLMTPAAAQLLQEAEAEAGSIPIHDWWAYQLVTGAGGTAILDEQPGLLYRQHGANVIGLKRGIRTVPGRLARHLRGKHREWALQNSAALAASSARLTPENRERLRAFTEALSAPLPGKLASLRRSGVYYQSPQARAAFWLSVAIGGF